MEQKTEKETLSEKKFYTIIITLNSVVAVLVIWFLFTILDKLEETNKQKLTEIANYSMNFGMENILRDQSISLSVNGIANQVMQKSKDLTRYKFYDSAKKTYGIQTLSIWERNSIDFKNWYSNNISNAGAFLQSQPTDERIVIGSPISNWQVHITSTYRIRKNVFEENVGGANDLLTHAAIDIGAVMNTPVLSASVGYVIKAGEFRGLGNTVWIYSTYWTGGQEQAFVFVYGHLNKFRTHVGSTVEIGQNIGLSGSTGLSLGPHTHWEIIQLDKNFKSNKEITKFIEQYYIDGRCNLSRDPLGKQFEIVYY